MTKKEGLCSDCPLRDVGVYTRHVETATDFSFNDRDGEEWISYEKRWSGTRFIGAGIGLGSRIGNLLLENAAKCDGPVPMTRLERFRRRRETRYQGTRMLTTSHCPALNQIPAEVVEAQIETTHSKIAENW